ncbi:hypothetical protein M0657_004828 [Pyricularia oryzae]|uniref:Uncharacterized protein n=1 Tax=Pyricularia oryzae TaxID=318829 RepID=A0A4P7NHE2_PYROR|nr:hypothetical protein M9X92_008203 [Pyricularia oryzae]KAI7923989.1 hypothetical protein M0657_004828 [Pyricularia oryzae]QBZ61296.1 hypothetical protein PoMZ_08245 [Pyricularia oryzae]
MPETAATSALFIFCHKLFRHYGVDNALERSWTSCSRHWCCYCVGRVFMADNCDGLSKPQTNG